jgi:hypothetical protein
MSESYTLFLNIGNPRNVTDANTYTYYVNWEAFLPKKYSKYAVNFSHQRNQTQSGVVSSVGFIRATALRSTYTTDPNYAGSFGLLGAYLPYTYMTDNVGNIRTAFYTKPWDNIPTLVNYPTNNYMSVTIESTAYVNNTFLAGSALVFLTFTPIKDKKKKKRNIPPRLKIKHKLEMLSN